MIVVLECEHCGAQETDPGGYDDRHYHEVVIPAIPCNVCEQKAGEDYVPRQPKYSENEIV